MSTDKPRDPIADAIKAFDKRTAHLRPAKPGEKPMLPIRLGTDIEMRAPQFFWSDRMPLDELNLIEGDQMHGKTTAMLDIAARVSRGMPMPFDATPRKPRAVLWYSPEEDTSKAGLPRFIAAGGDPAQFIEIRREPGTRGPQMTFPSGTHYLDNRLEDLKARGYDVGLLAIDGVSVILDDGTKENSNNYVKGAIEAMLIPCRKHGVAVIGLRHFSKSRDASPEHRGAGSIGFGAMARSQWVLLPHPEDPDRKLFAPVKWSYSKRRPRSLALSLVSRDVRLADNVVSSFGAIEWHEETDITAGEAMEAASKAAKGKASSKQVEAAAASIEAAMTQLEAEHVEAGGDIATFSIPENILRDWVCGKHGAPASAYFQAKKTLTGAKKFRAEPVAGVWMFRRWRTQYGKGGF